MAITESNDQAAVGLVTPDSCLSKHRETRHASARLEGTAGSIGNRDERDERDGRDGRDTDRAAMCAVVNQSKPWPWPCVGRPARAHANRA